eukprot:TRINITY_DN17625_c0_g1_i1.p1 TRINITY_DN17625_c0_g1~~TRINITY_DN17625_c0_g1_i1.p1  ORF type:complete len:157 (-),score=39.28 TRINITY_DN17625_c0_g1_i1:41-511(-)
MQGDGKNLNPVIYKVAQLSRNDDIKNLNDDEEDPIDELEVFDLIRHINDPEHPLTLEQLKVTDIKNVKVDDENSLIEVKFTPTIPHCSMATLIGLSIRTKLLRSLPERFKIDVLISPGTHASEEAINRQLNDKERVSAALENGNLLKVINNCVAHT